MNTSKMLQIFKTLVFLLYATASFQVKCRALNHPARGFCATGPPEDSLRAEHDRLNALETQDAVAVNYESREVVRPIEIVTWFHILLGSEDDENMVSDEMIATQVGFTYRCFGQFICQPGLCEKLIGFFEVVLPSKCLSECIDIIPIGGRHAPDQ